MNYPTIELGRKSYQNFIGEITTNTREQTIKRILPRDCFPTGHMNDAIDVGVEYETYELVTLYFRIDTAHNPKTKIQTKRTAVVDLYVNIEAFAHDPDRKRRIQDTVENNALWFGTYARRETEDYFA